MKHYFYGIGVLGVILSGSFAFASTQVERVGDVVLYRGAYYADPQDNKGTATVMPAQLNSHIWIGSPLTISTSLKGDSSEETVILSPKIHLKSGTHLKGRSIRIKSL
jgi:hypothetical protein